MMSILLQAAPAVPAPAGPTTLPATSPMQAYVIQMLVATAMGLACLGFAWALGWWRGERRRWGPPRCPAVAQAGPLWLVAGLMFFVSRTVPLILLATIGGRPDAPSTRPGDVRVGPGDETQLLLMSITYVVGLAVAVFAHMAIRWQVDDPLGLRPLPRAGHVTIGLVGLAVATSFTYATAHAMQVLWHWLHVPQETTHALLQLMGRVEQAPLVLVLAILNAALLAPVFEELLFRGHLQTALTSLFPNRWAAIVVTSALFALMHEPWMIPPIFVLSLIIGYLYERTSSLWVAILVHVGFNALSTAMFLVTRGAL